MDPDRAGGAAVVHGQELDGGTRSVALARDAVRQHLEGLDEEVVEAALLLVSELATNAVLHARTSYRVEVEVSRDTVRVSVLDDSPVKVTRRVNGVDAATGRGLALVETLSTRWGPTATADLRGRAKGIWFELPLDPGRLKGFDEGSLYGDDWLALAEEL